MASSEEGSGEPLHLATRGRATPRDRDRGEDKADEEEDDEEGEEDDEEDSEYEDGNKGEESHQEPELSASDGDDPVTPQSKRFNSIRSVNRPETKGFSTYLDKDEREAARLAMG